MGITVVRKSDPANLPARPKLGLVLAGGAISGGAFKVGGLKALNDFMLNRKVTDFDVYVGISAGAFLAAPLAGGIPPEEMLQSLDGKSEHFSQLSPLHLYYPNAKEFITRPARFVYGHLMYIPGVIADLLSSFPHLSSEFWKSFKELIRHPNYTNYEKLMKPVFRAAYSTRTIPTVGELLPSGLFDNRPIEKFIRTNMKNNHLTNNFKVLRRMNGKSLYVVAMDLDTSERVVFGPDEKNDVTISQAVMASSAIPGFYKPARIKGVDYIDGGVRRTANIDLAFEKGADLVICYNPFRPYNNKVILEYLREENKYITKNRRISDWGLGMIFNQVFRTLFHSRLQIGIQQYLDDPSFKKDIILIEPKEDDCDFFEMNPLMFWNRAKAAQHGFASVRRSIDRHYEKVAGLLKVYGIEMSREIIDADEKRIKTSRNDDATIMDVLEEQHPKNRLKVVRAAR